MKRPLREVPPPSLVAYELEPGKVLFVHTLDAVAPIAGLTRAEQRVVELLLAGLDTASIAAARETSPRTVSNQVASIYKKLGVGCRAELVAKLLNQRASTPSRGP